MNNIVYLAIKSEHVYKEVEMSIKSLFYVLRDSKCAEQYHIVVYTDNLTFFNRRFAFNKSVQIDYRDISEWEFDNVYLRKIDVIEDFAKQYGQDFIFLDSDTYFMSSPESLFKTLVTNGTVLMYLKENTLNEKINYVFDRFSNIFHSSSRSWCFVFCNSMRSPRTGYS